MNKVQTYNSPDEFMFLEFEIHSSIFHKINQNDYFMISSGTNQFPLPKLWKKTLYQEINSDYLYRWYTSAAGFQTSTRSLKIYEDYLAGNGSFFSKKMNNDICMTIGGSGAASLTFDYLKKIYSKCEIVLVGMNYSLYERLSKKNGFNIIELSSAENIYTLPDLSDFMQLPSSASKRIFVFSNPNNPLGRTYDRICFLQIIKYIHNNNGFVILDQVCDLVISQKKYMYLENIITEYIGWKDAVIINSFSKTDSTAGLRIGYIYGDKELINIVNSIQADSIMNPPTFPVFSILLTCMFRCIYLNKNNINYQYKEEKIIKLFENIFYYTGAIIPKKMKIYAKKVFGNYRLYYDNYIQELLNNEKKIYMNYYMTLNFLKPYILCYSELQGGFNFCVWFKKKFKITELELTQLLIKNTGVAILSESSFTTKPQNNNRYFIRFSTACDVIEYKNALIRLCHYIEKGEIFDD